MLNVRVRSADGNRRVAPARPGNARPATNGGAGVPANSAAFSHGGRTVKRT
jgi:hypothetical protein